MGETSVLLRKVWFLWEMLVWWSMMGFIDADVTIDNGDTGLKNDGQDWCVTSLEYDVQD